MVKFTIREDLLPLLGEDFYQFYRLNRSTRFEKLTSSAKVNAAVSRMFSHMYDMLEEYNHGISLKDFGIIAPKEFIYEDKKSIFKVKYTKKGRFVVILENEYLQSQYRTLFQRKTRKKFESVIKEVRKPRPYAVMLHRNNIRKNKLKDAED